MNSFARACLLHLAFLACTAHAAAPDASLVGCWRAVKIVLVAPDGAKAEDTSGRCTLHFQEDTFESTCGTTTGTATTTYTYAIPRPNVYLATMTRSTYRTSLVGSTREYEYRVDGDRLVTVALPSPTAARVETEAARMPCP